MDTQELLHCLMHETDFGGVTSVNRLNLIEKNKFYIVNTDASYNPGKHWVAIFTSKIPEFFDSLGQAPSHYDRRFECLMIHQGPVYRYNSKRIQNYGSETCGQYCIYYVMQRSKGYSMEDIVNNFSGIDLYGNDKKVYRFHDDLLRSLELY